MTKIYIVYCFQCHMTIDEDDDQMIAGWKAVQHIMNSPHMFVSVLDRQQAEEKGIAWPGSEHDAD